MTCFCYNSCCLSYLRSPSEFIFQQDSAPAQRACLLSDINISQSSDSTFGTSGFFIDHFIANLLLCAPVKEISKIGQYLA